ncbi:MAG: beta-galactosidase [Opitutales bacterium]|nr:beta-galactosidase [Opitutales bacterium]
MPLPPDPIPKIDLRSPNLSLQTGHLKVGGINPQGVEIQANSRCLTLGGAPWFPIMGEFHFTRYPHIHWEEALLKMKAGGVNVVATYVFWIHHEEIENEWEWSGNYDLRAFIELCGKHGLYAWPRIGPWAHGEVRNGGYPDWLLEKCGAQNVRRDSEPYLSQVRKFYTEIAAQLDGLLWKQGGPIIGTQLDNELTDNPSHIVTLKKLAIEAGIDVPLYTMTGWMNARIPQDEVIPVFGGYADAFWSEQSDSWARECRRNYIFSAERDDTNIGVDVSSVHQNGGASSAEGQISLASLERYPYGTCEVGGGMQVSYRRRAAIAADDIAALALCKLGSGSNLQGYYMYHGGMNPAGKRTTLQESRATGYPNEMPVKNYDFQAPLRAYGQRNESYHTLRMQHLFLADFGDQLASLPPALPESQPASLDDSETLRWSVRSDGKQGFVFVNNYQRIESLPKREGVQFEITLNGQTEPLMIPQKPLNIPEQCYFIWPFNWDIEGVRLIYATAQPVCRIGETFVFAEIAGIEAEFGFDSSTLADPDQALLDLQSGLHSSAPSVVRIKGKNNKQAKILLLNPNQARQVWKASIWGEEHLFLSEAGLIFDGDTLRLQSTDPSLLSCAVYPTPKAQLQASASPEGAFTRLVPSPPTIQRIDLEWQQLQQAQSPAAPVRRDTQGVPLAPDDADFDSAAIWHLRIPSAQSILDHSEVREVFLQIHYTGDVARAYLADVLIDDDFYFGRVWEIGLSRFDPDLLEKGITLKILPLRKDAPIYIPADRWPQMDARGESVGIHSISAKVEYELSLKP